MEYVRDNGLDQKVHLLGEQSPAETRNLLLGFDAFVLASRFEGLPLTIIEAMFAGLPVVASDVGGVKELVQNDRNGLLFAADDVDELTRKIVYLINNRDERLRMGCEGQRIAQLHFSAERMTRQYESLYLRGVPEEKPPVEAPSMDCSCQDARTTLATDAADSSVSSYKEGP